MKQLKFRTRDGNRQVWQMLLTDVKKALKSVETTCDGNGGDECHVLFTRHGGIIINVDAMDGRYGVSGLELSKARENSRRSTVQGILAAWKHGSTSAWATQSLKVLPGRLQLHKL